MLTPSGLQPCLVFSALTPNPYWSITHPGLKHTTGNLKWQSPEPSASSCPWVAYSLWPFHSFGEANTPNPANSANPFSCPVTQKDIAVKATSVVGVLSLVEQCRWVHLDVGNHHLFEHWEVCVGVRHFLLLFFPLSTKYTTMALMLVDGAQRSNWENVKKL